MIEPTMPEPVDDETLQSLITSTVTACAGVARLEPSLRSALAGLAAHRKRIDTDARSESADGVRVTTYGLITDVAIEIAVEQDSQALATASMVQDQARQLLVSSGREPGAIRVTVLGVG